MSVVNFSRMAPGPFAGRLLADLGASVTMIESPGAAVAAPPGLISHDVRARGEHPLYQRVFSEVLNLKNEDDYLRARELTSAADIVIEGFRPGVMERLGLGYEAVRSSNPQIIYASLTGFGQNGELADQRGHDLDFLAESGLLSVMMRRGNPPEVPLNIVADYAAGGLYSAYAILTAVLARKLTATGCHLDLAIVDHLKHLMEPARAWLMSDSEYGDGRFFTGDCPFYASYRSKDDGWFTVTAVEEQSFASLLKATGLERYASHRRDPKRWPELSNALTAWAGGRSLAEALSELRRAQVPAGQVRELRDALVPATCAQRKPSWPHPLYFRDHLVEGSSYTPHPGVNTNRSKS